MPVVRVCITTLTVVERAADVLDPPLGHLERSGRVGDVDQSEVSVAVSVREAGWGQLVRIATAWQCRVGESTTEVGAVLDFELVDTACNTQSPRTQVPPGRPDRSRPTVGDRVGTRDRLASRRRPVPRPRRCHGPRVGRTRQYRQRRLRRSFPRGSGAALPLRARRARRIDDGDAVVRRDRAEPTVASRPVREPPLADVGEPFVGPDVSVEPAAA